MRGFQVFTIVIERRGFRDVASEISCFCFVFFFFPCVVWSLSSCVCVFLIACLKRTNGRRKTAKVSTTPQPVEEDDVVLEDDVEVQDEDLKSHGNNGNVLNFFCRLDVVVLKPTTMTIRATTRTLLTPMTIRATARTQPKRRRSSVRSFRP